MCKYHSIGWCGFVLPTTREIEFFDGYLHIFSTSVNGPHVALSSSSPLSSRVVGFIFVQPSIRCPSGLEPCDKRLQTFLQKTKQKPLMYFSVQLCLHLCPTWATLRRYPIAMCPLSSSFPWFSRPKDSQYGANASLHSSFSNTRIRTQPASQFLQRKTLLPRH